MPRRRRQREIQRSNEKSCRGLQLGCVARLRGCVQRLKSNVRRWTFAAKCSTFIVSNPLTAVSTRTRIVTNRVCWQNVWITRSCYLLAERPFCSRFINFSLSSSFGLHLTRLGCNECHRSPGYTTPAAYDVGVHDKLGNTHFNPPSLRGISQRERYSHDNRARTLREVFTRFKHGYYDRTSPTWLSDLLTFLNSL